MKGRRVRAALGLLIFFASLPMQWQVLAPTPLGPLRWFHVGALILLVLAPPRVSAIVQIRARVRPLTGALIVLTLMLVATAWAYGSLRGSLLQPIQNLVYVLIALEVGAALLVALGDAQARNIAAWSGPVALISFLFVFGGTLSSAGVGPAAVLSGLFSSDPDAAFIRFFRIAFHSVNEEAVNTRHEIFAALIVACFVSLICRPEGRSRTLVNISVVVVAIITVLSLSRAVILAGSLPLALAGVRSLLRNRVSLYALALIGVLLAVSPVVVPPVWSLLEGRFAEDTGSYDARLAALPDVTSGDFIGRALLGGGDFGRSTHTMVLDATMRGGLIAGVAALVVIAVFVRHTVRASRAFMNSGELEALAAFGAGALVLTRSFTQGGGLPHLVEWCAVAAMIVAEMVRRQPLSDDGSGATPPSAHAAVNSYPRRDGPDGRRQT